MKKILGVMVTMFFLICWPYYLIWDYRWLYGHTL